jgi:hypothetical protein
MLPGYRVYYYQVQRTLCLGGSGPTLLQFEGLPTTRAVGTSMIGRAGDVSDPLLFHSGLPFQAPLF